MIKLKYLYQIFLENLVLIKKKQDGDYPVFLCWFLNYSSVFSSAFSSSSHAWFMNVLISQLVPSENLHVSDFSVETNI